MKFPPYQGSASEEILKAAQLRNAINIAMHRLPPEALEQVFDHVKELSKPYITFPTRDDSASVPELY